MESPDLKRARLERLRSSDPAVPAVNSALRHHKRRLGLHRFPGLDEAEGLPWSEIPGLGDDPYGWLKELGGADREGRGRALSSLFTASSHEDVMSAAFLAITPFLLGFLEADHPDTDAILALLLHLTHGALQDIPDGFKPAEAIDPQARVVLWPFEGRPWRALSHRDIERSLYESVRRGLPLIRELAAEGRRQAAFLLAWFPDDAADSLPVLRALREETRGPLALSELLLAIALLQARAEDSPDLVDLERRFAEDRPAWERLSATLAWLTITRSGPQPAARSWLLEAIERPDPAAFPPLAGSLWFGESAEQVREGVRDHALALLPSLFEKEPGPGLDFLLKLMEAAIAADDIPAATRPSASFHAWVCGARESRYVALADSELARELDPRALHRLLSRLLLLRDQVRQRDPGPRVRRLRLRIADCALVLAHCGSSIRPGLRAEARHAARSEYSTLSPGPYRTRVDSLPALGLSAEDLGLVGPDEPLTF